MQVIIDGVEYVPKESMGIEAHGITYNSIAHWLYNIHSIMVNRWVETLREGKSVDNPESIKLFERVKEFEKFAEEFLGYKESLDNYEYIEIPDWTLADYGKERIKINNDERRTINIGGDKADRI